MNVFRGCAIISLFVFKSEWISAQLLLPPMNIDEYDAYGSLLAMNEYLTILAQNDEERFTIIFNPFTNHSRKCYLSYDTVQHDLESMTRFVYSVAIGAKQNASQLSFAYINENWQRDVFLTIIFLEPTTTGCVRIRNRTSTNMTSLKMRERVVIGIDPYGEQAYAVGTYYIVGIDIETREEWKLNISTLFDNPNSTNNFFFLKALIVTEDHYLLAVGQKLINFQFFPHLLLLHVLSPSNVTLISETQLSDFNFGPSSIDITRQSTMSMAFLDQVDRFIIGIPHLNTLIFASWNNSDTSKEPVILRNYTSPQQNIFLGKSIALLDNNTFAVLAHTLPTFSWSTSQVQLYSFNDDESFDNPLIIYPNNQQIIPSLHSIPPPHSILTIVSWQAHLGLVFDAGVALILSTSPPGYYTGQIDNDIFDMNMYTSMACIPGTARNTTSFGPCFLCPAGTKNNGTSGIDCEKCDTDDSLLCLRGALVEITLDDITDNSQAIPYPDPPDSLVYDDALLEHIFRFATGSSQCLVSSPLFWTSLAIGWGLLISLLMGILAYFPRFRPHRAFLKTLFMHIDLIGEGELWLGGLLTLAIIVLFVFTCKFGLSFARLYPIETALENEQIESSCDSIVPNAKFSSVLQLLAILRHEEEEAIFMMLEEQDITLTVHFVSTGFPCRSVKLQENLDRGQRIPLKNFHCGYDNGTSILSVSTALPQQLITMQLDLIGPYFVGGVRLCLTGPSIANVKNDNILRELQFCQFFHVDNETLAINPTIDVKMTKVVNRTMGYAIRSQMNISGIWIPTVTLNTPSDALLFKENGEYTRYLSDRVTVVIHITESEFFVKNTQEPIARHTEIILHTILFTVVLLELFSLLFLFIKLAITPLLKLIKRRCSTKRNPSIKSNKYQREVSEINVDEIFTSTKL